MVLLKILCYNMSLALSWNLIEKKNKSRTANSNQFQVLEVISYLQCIIQRCLCLQGVNVQEANYIVISQAQIYSTKSKSRKQKIFHGFRLIQSIIRITRESTFVIKILTNFEQKSLVQNTHQKEICVLDVVVTWTQSGSFMILMESMRLKTVYVQNCTFE